MPFNTVQILTNERIADNIYRMTVPCGDAINPGQFYMLKGRGGASLLPRAISVCDYKNGVLTFLYQTVGAGTNELAAMRRGDMISLTGPLGNGFPVENLSGKIALAAGGIGIAPMLYTAKRLAEMGVAIDCLCGFRDEVYLPDELKSISTVAVATETGSVGTKGFMTALLVPEKYDAVLCCGPGPMMKAVVKLCMEKNTPVYVSLENKMACGVGGCLVCTCTDKNGKNLRTCKDGPVFRGEDIDFDA